MRHQQHRDLLRLAGVHCPPQPHAVAGQPARHVGELPGYDPTSSCLTQSRRLPVQVDIKVASARKAQPGWAGGIPVERATVLSKLAALMTEHADELVAEEVSQTGKPARLASEFDVPGSIDNVDFFAGAARHLEGKASAEYSGDGNLNGAATTLATSTSRTRGRT